MDRNPSARAITLAALTALAVGCITPPPTSPEDSGPEDPSATPSSIRITPTSVSLSVGQEHAFVAEIKDEHGQPTEQSVTWTATGGTITDKGRFKATGRGKHKVIGRVKKQNKEIADTAVVSVDDPRPPSSDGPPTAAFTAACDDLECSLDARDSSDPDGDIVDYEWTLGDGTTASGQAVDHDYSEAGDYEVRLVVTDDAGEQDEVTHAVVVMEDDPPPPAPNQAPQAAFSVDCFDLTCSLSATGSSDSDGSIVDYDWALGDGSTAAGDSIVHEYGSEGTFEVVLTVTDDDGASDSASDEVTVDAPASPPPPPPPPSGDPQPNGPSGSWDLALGEEFDGSSLDGSTWTPHYAWWPTDINGELQYFDPDRPYVSGGTLKLTADRTAQNGKSYTSGAVSSHGKFSFTFGVAEMRAKLPAGKGLWPAFWTMPQAGGWPPEIDIMENIGDPNRVHFNLHYSGGNMGAPSFSGLDTRQWHTYTVHWRSDRIDWYVDGTLRASYTNAGNIPQQSMYLLLNLAVGGSWPGSPDSSTPFPATYEIDYVRVWQ